VRRRRPRINYLHEVLRTDGFLPVGFRDDAGAIYEKYRSYRVDRAKAS
jgi:hypothetical protein